MKVLYIDLETTGLDHDCDNVLEVGCVLDNFIDPLVGLPRFHCYVVKERYAGHPFALALNAGILKIIAERAKHPAICSQPPSSSKSDSARPICAASASAATA